MKIHHKACLFSVLVLCMVFLFGCGQREQEEEQGEAYTIYYLNAAGNPLSGADS